MRASRLVSLLLLLQSRGRMTAAALADALEVSERTIYRDLADLGAAGVPVYGERGEGGGYRLLDGYRTNLTGLTAEEAETLLLGGAAGPMTELGLGSALAAARLKLLAAVPTGLRDVATRAEQRFYLDPGPWAHAAARDDRHLRTVAAAVWRDRRLRLEYRRGDGLTVRRLLDPLGLVHKTGTWYLVAGAENGTRVYRVDRIRGAEVLDSPARRPDGFDLARYWPAWEAAYAQRLLTYAVRVRLGPTARLYLDRLGAVAPRRRTESGPDADGWSHATLVFDDHEIALTALQAFLPDVEVLEPAELREAMLANARRLLEAASVASALTSPLAGEGSLERVSSQPGGGTVERPENR